MPHANVGIEKSGRMSNGASKYKGGLIARHVGEHGVSDNGTITWETSHCAETRPRRAPRGTAALHLTAILGRCVDSQLTDRSRNRRVHPASQSTPTTSRRQPLASPARAYMEIGTSSARPRLTWAIKPTECHVSDPAVFPQGTYTSRARARKKQRG